MNFSLKGKNALVCGSSKGIGRASAIELAKMGATITLVSRSPGKMSDLISEMVMNKEEGQDHDFIVADFSNPMDLKKKVRGLIATKTIHILVNNTGGPPGGPILDAHPNEFLQALNNHLICNHLLVSLLSKGMREAGFGRIINIISTSVKAPIDGLGVSNTTRGAVANWAKTMANELARYQITVNNVLPGFTSTGRLKEVMENRAQKSGQDLETIKEKMENSVPMRRFADPSEVAAAVAFLASPAASYITGINLPVDGGRTRSL